jgi:transposase
MDVARRIYSRDLKIAAMREIDGGRRIGEVARHLEVSPKLLERWRGEWQAQGALAFPGIGRRGLSPALTEQQRIGELERKIGQLTMENDFLKKALEHFRDHHPPAVVSGEADCLRKSVKPRRKAKP